ncbi:10505_t:CDS:2 [Entrophospora sp. SA101]|nr:10505_t:CDS:2 [Entrophospora sp. SA101]
MPSLDVQIQKLEKTLLSNEAYINYLEKEISNRDEGLGELEILRKNNMDLQKRLKKALLDTEANRAQAQINQDAKTIIKLNAAARIADEELSLMTRVYHNERQARRNMQSLYNKKNRRVVELLREKFATQLLCTNRQKKIAKNKYVSE